MNNVVQFPRRNGLSPREQQIVSHLSQGFSNEKIAQLLGIPESVAQAHIRQVTRQMRAHKS